MCKCGCEGVESESDERGGVSGMECDKAGAEVVALELAVEVLIDDGEGGASEFEVDDFEVGRVDH